MGNKKFKASSIWLAVTLAGLTEVTAATPAINPYDAAELFVNPDYVVQVQSFFDRNQGYLDKAKKLHLLDNNGAWMIPTAIWLDSKEAIVGYPAEGRGSHSMLYYLTQAAERAATKPVAITFVVYDLPIRDCNAYSSNGEFKSHTDLVHYEQDYIGDPAVITPTEATPTTIVGSLQRFYDGSIPNANNVRIALVIEPDSLPNMITNVNVTPQCKEAHDNKTYVSGISYALTTLNSFNTADHQNIYMYLDIGHSGWLGWKDNANQITSMYNNNNLPGFDAVRGFITNTANYSPLTEGFSYDEYLKNNAIMQTKFYSWNDVFDETSYIAEIMSIASNGQLQIDGNHRISAPASPYYADKHFLVDTSRNGWMLNSTDYKNSTGTAYPRRDQRHHRGNWCNVESVQPSTTSYENQMVPMKATSAGLGLLPVAAPNVVNPLYKGASLPIDAYVWIKPPSEADGYYDAAQNLGDQMCGSSHGGSHNDDQSTDSLQDGATHAPHAGLPFDAAFRHLIDAAGCINQVFTSKFCE